MIEENIGSSFRLKTSECDIFPYHSPKVLNIFRTSKRFESKGNLWTQMSTTYASCRFFCSIAPPPMIETILYNEKEWLSHFIKHLIAKLSSLFSIILYKFFANKMIPEQGENKLSSKRLTHQKLRFIDRTIVSLIHVTLQYYTKVKKNIIILVMRLVLEKPINFTRNPRGNNTTILKKIENPNTLKIKNKKKIIFSCKTLLLSICTRKYIKNYIIEKIKN